MKANYPLYKSTARFYSRCLLLDISSMQWDILENLKRRLFHTFLS